MPRWAQLHDLPDICIKRYKQKLQVTQRQMHFLTEAWVQHEFAWSALGQVFVCAVARRSACDDGGVPRLMGMPGKRFCPCEVTTIQATHELMDGQEVQPVWCRKCGADGSMAMVSLRKLCEPLKTSGKRALRAMRKE